MSKQSEAKEKQNYRTTPRTCSNCAHYESIMVAKTYGWSGMAEEKRKRCSLGNFSVKKMAVCDLYSTATNANQ